MEFFGRYAIDGILYKFFKVEVDEIFLTNIPG